MMSFESSRSESAPACTDLVGTVASGAVTVDWSDPDNVTRREIETPRGTTVLRVTSACVAIKVPGHRYWAGIGIPRGYARTETIVYARAEAIDCRTAKCYELARW